MMSAVDLDSRMAPPSGPVRRILRFEPTTMAWCSCCGREPDPPGPPKRKTPVLRGVEIMGGPMGDPTEMLVRICHVCISRLRKTCPYVPPHRRSR